MATDTRTDAHSGAQTGGRTRGAFEVLVRRLASFGVVGIAAAIVDFGVFNALQGGPAGPFAAKALGTCCGALVAYAGNRWWSFRDRVRTGVRREFTLFFVFNAIGLGIAEACLLVCVDVLGYRGVVAVNVSGSVVGFLLATVFRFWAYGRFVFLKPVEPQIAAADSLAVAAAITVP